MTWGELRLGDVVHHVRGSSWLVIAVPVPGRGRKSDTVWLELLHLDEGKTYEDSRIGTTCLAPAFWLEPREGT